MQKLLMGGLALAIIAVIGFGLIDAAQTPEEEPESVALVTIDQPTVTPEATATPVPTIVSGDALAAETTPDPQPVVQAASTMGDPWEAEGSILSLEDFGFTLATESGEFFVELGPPTYWQAQDVVLAQGDTVTVDGYYNGEQVHARVVYANGAELTIRTEAGQPMWAGGADHTTDGTAGQQAGSAGVQSQVAPEDWVTLTGVIGTVSNGNVTLNVNDGTIVNLQMGQPQFWQSQGIALNVGDPVEVLGFWSGDQFMTGEIRKTETGETIILRDPNGRQLWGGPGRNGAQGNQGNGNQGNGQDGGNGNQGNGNQGNSSQTSGSQGNGYRGGRS